MNESEFIRRVGQSDDEKKRVLSELFASYDRALQRWIRGKFRLSDHLAEDLVMDAWEKIFKNLDKYTGQGSLEGWLKTITLNVVRDYLRTQNIRVTESDKSNLGQDSSRIKIVHVDESSVPEVSVNRDGAHENCVRMVFEELKNKYVEIFNFIEWVVEDGPTSDEMAAKLGTTPGTARERKASYLRKLSELCLKHCGTDDCSLWASSH